MIILVREPWRPDPLAWIHRAEASGMARELRKAGHAVELTTLTSDFLRNPPAGRMLLRLSDPVMCATASALNDHAYAGPGAAALERCYDKYAAVQLARRQGVACPFTCLANDAADAPIPRVIKPRRGSDSIGVRIRNDRVVPDRFANGDHIVQEQVIGRELTVAVLGQHVGLPLEILLPEARVYSFWRKYLWRPRIRPLAAPDLAERVRGEAMKIASALNVDWAVRIDFIVGRSDDRAYMLECDAAPMLGAASAFAASLAAAGVQRSAQLEALLGLPVLDAA